MKEAILLIGQGKLSFSVAACLLRAGHPLTFVHPQPGIAEEAVARHIAESREKMPEFCETGPLTVATGAAGEFPLAILVTRDRVEEKAPAIATAEKHLAPGGVLAVNLESMGLETLQDLAGAPDRLLGLNWVEPAHTTFFMEIVTNELSDSGAVEYVKGLASRWDKDPYILRNGFSVRARLTAALTREALFLVSRGYATHEDIDRNCRNDAGYYLPFAGNARYMDLMGTYAYGIVMKDLNRNLSKDPGLDKATSGLLEEDLPGMESGRGFFNYSPEEAKEWEDKMSSFSYQVRRLIGKYPFEPDSK